MPPHPPERIPEPKTRKLRKLLRSYDIKLVDPVTEDGVELFKVRMPGEYRVVSGSETADSHEWYVVSASNVAVARIVRGADGALSTVPFERPPKGFDADAPPPRA